MNEYKLQKKTKKELIEIIQQKDADISDILYNPNTCSASAKEMKLRNEYTELSNKYNLLHDTLRTINALARTGKITR